MTVKELIEKLQKLNSEKEVVILYNEDNPIIDKGRGIEQVFEISGTTDDVVYIQEI